MAIADLRGRLVSGPSLVTGWVSLPEPLVGEACVRAGFEAVLVDMQHGLVDVGAAFRLITAIRRTGGRVMVRIPVGETQTASRLLDAGADAVVAPMIESAADAAAFAATMKYPPLGERSWGPTRAVQLSGGDAGSYRTSANHGTLAIAMIETRAALDAADEILALPGIDGLFVGPSDLSIALSGGTVLDVDSADNVAAISRIASAARAAGKFAGIYAHDGAHARTYFAAGYSFVTVASDVGYLTAGARALIADCGG
jgi:4-hydroxy-2-oxoheptanedioate aldolase